MVYVETVYEGYYVGGVSSSHPGAFARLVPAKQAVG
jgi:hypothetical protein